MSKRKIINKSNQFFDVKLFNKIQGLTNLTAKHLKSHPDDSNAAAVLGVMNGALLLQGRRIQDLYVTAHKKNY